MRLIRMLGLARMNAPKMEKHKEILTVLTEELERGKYRVGERFPSEWGLVNRFKVGRSTINKAVDKLVADGWLERGVRGSGTRVKSVHRLIRGRILYFGNMAHPTYVAAMRGLASRAFFRGYFTSCAEPPPFEQDSFLTTITAIRRLPHPQREHCRKNGRELSFPWFPLRSGCQIHCLPF